MAENAEQPRWLNAEQEARAQALRTAREVLRKGNPFTSSVEVNVPDLVDVAEYVISGTHPLDRVTNPADTEWAWPGDEPQQVIGHVGEVFE